AHFAIRPALRRTRSGRNSIACWSDPSALGALAEEGLLAMKIAQVVCLSSLAAAAAAGVALLSSAADGQTGPRMARGDGKLENVADIQGNLHVPSDYRAVYEFLGTWAIAADKGAGSSEMHDVYATPGTIAAFHKNGHFPDGAVLIKEVYQTSTAPMTTGTVSHAQNLKGWFVMVKDSKNSHPGNFPVGGWLGVVVVRSGKSDENNVNRLQKGFFSEKCRRGKCLTSRTKAPSGGIGSGRTLVKIGAGGHQDPRGARSTLQAGQPPESPRRAHFGNSRGRSPGGHGPAESRSQQRFKHLRA